MTPGLTVLLWLWKGWRPIYAARHVHAMAVLLRMFLPGCRIVVLTDQALPLCCVNLTDAVLPLPPHPLPERYRKRGPFDCWVRMHQCDAHWLTHTAGVPNGGPVMSMDLDMVPIGNLWPLLDGGHDGIAMKSASAVLNPSLLYQARPGVLQQAWDELTVTNISRIPAHMVGSDQAWLSHCYREHRDGQSWKLLTRDHGAYVFAARMGKCPAPPVLWSFAGQRKPWDRAARVATPRAWELWRQAAVPCLDQPLRRPVSVTESGQAPAPTLPALPLAAPAVANGQAHIQRAADEKRSPVLTKVKA